jgi:signal transduction histidine kinase
MKRSWVSIFIVAVVLGLLTLFLGLQYRWLTEVSRAERERMQKRVETDTGRFAEDFNREMQAAYYNFQTESRIWKNSEWDEFNQRYDFWKERTAYPELIREIYFVSKSADTRPLRYDPAKRGFDPADTNAALDEVRVRLLSDENMRAVDDDSFSLVLPVYDTERHIEHIVLRGPERDIKRDVSPVFKRPEKFGWVVIQLDPAVIKERILPELAGKYFPDSYTIGVADSSGRPVFATGETTAADASAPMFDMSPDNMMFFSRSDAMPKMIRERRDGVVIDQRIESHSFTRTEKDGTSGGTLQLELKQADGKSKPRATVTATAAQTGRDPWMLSVQHTAGSIDAFVASERNRDLAIGLGIYALLVAGILAIVISALRSKRFAQRQIDFLSSVSHEFRTPLAVIYSAGENLADGVAKDTSQVSRYGELIKGEGRKLSGKVEQILEFAGASSGKQKYKLSAADVCEVVRDAIAECRSLTESGGFEIETEFGPGLPHLAVDRAALSSAIQNLIANSVKYANGSKWIRISALNGGNAIRISVEDRGIGIRRDDMRRIFDPFYRAKEVVDAQISGNGLGLNLVKKIAEAHGGRVMVESKPGTGSKFTIELPQR